MATHVQTPAGKHPVRFDAVAVPMSNNPQFVVPLVVQLNAADKLFAQYWQTPSASGQPKQPSPALEVTEASQNGIARFSIACAQQAWLAQFPANLLGLPHIAIAATMFGIVLVRSTPWIGTPFSHFHSLQLLYPLLITGR